MTTTLRRFASLVLAQWALAAGGVALAQAPEETIFGPKTYQHPSAPPSFDVDVFALPAGIAGPFKLKVWNGEANGHDRVEAAWIFLNGVQIAGPHDFDRKVYTFERTVQVRPQNLLVVIINGKPDTRIRLGITGRRILAVPTSLAPNPLAVTAGAAGVLTATLAPAPTSAGNLAVASANSSVATVPASVPFAAGQTAVQIPVTGQASGTTTVTASLNGGAASATVNVIPSLPTITSLAPPTLTVTQGASGNLSVTISSAQPGGTTVLLSSSNSSVAVPPSVTVPAGQVSAQFQVSGVSAGSSQVTASLNGSSASSQVTVTPAPPTAVSLLPVVSTVTLGASTNLTLTISAAQPSDTTVPITAGPGGLVTVPASVVVPAGQTTATVPVTSLAYGQAGVTASLNGSTASAIVNVVPPPLGLTAIEPATLSMNVGATSTFTVRINAAQIANSEVALESSNPAVLQVPPSVTVAQGQTSATFTATALATGDAIITATANNTQRTAFVHVSPQPAAVVSLLPSPLPLQQGATGSLTVTINVAQEADTTLFLTSSAPAVASVPDSVVVPAGAISAQVPVTAVSPGPSQVTASINGSSATAAVNVSPPPPVASAVTPATLSLPKGTSGELRVTVSRAPNVVTVVTLSTSDQAVASVPGEVSIPAGALFADFAVAANAVGTASITATLNGGAASSTVSVAPAELALLTLSPQTPTAYTGETVPFTVTGTMTDGTTEDFTNRVTWTSSESGVATINVNGVASAIAAGQTTIGAAFTFSSVLGGQPVTVSTSTTLTVKQPVALVLTAPTTTLVVGQSTTVTVTSIDPAPVGGLVVNLAGGGTGLGTHPAAVTIPEGGTTATFVFEATAEGAFSITASAQNRLPGSITFTIEPRLAITAFTPAAGPVGTAVAISGSGFDPNLSGNQVKFNGETAVIVSGNATLLNVIVPPRATSGMITVTNFRGTAASGVAFTVQEREAFDITLAPLAIQVPPGGNGGTRIRLASTGLNPYPYAANVTISGLPTGVTATFDRPTVALNQDAIVTLSAAAGAPAGGFTVTLSVNGASGVTTQTVTKTLGVQVLAAGGTTVTGRVVHADDAAPFVGARVRLGQTHVFTDESGTYRFTSPPALGDQVLLIDGNTNNTPQFEFPSGIAMPVMIVAGQDNKVLTSYIGRIDANKFTVVVPGQAASVINEEVPNFSLNIQSGQIIFGWDGQPITKINVRKVPVDRLPIRPIPEGVETRSVYLFYFFREGGGEASTPIPVTMANDIEAAPGEKVTLYYYDEQPIADPNSNQWKVMPGAEGPGTGRGTVSEDGKFIVSDLGTGIPRFCCGAAFAGRNGAGATGATGGNGNCPKPPGAPSQPQTTDPVDLASGNALLFLPRPFGLSIPMPVNPNAQYRSTDPRAGFAGLLGRGFSFTYDWFAEPLGAGPTPPAVRVTNPAGVQFMLAREADGTYRSGAGRSGSIEMVVTPTPNGGRTLRLADGTRYEFNGPGRLQAITDIAGNRMTFEVDANGFPLSITDATGKVYEFQVSGVNQSTRIDRITDPAGRYIEFLYNGARDLIGYRDQGGNLTQFGYTGSRVSQVTDPRNAVKTIQYDAANRAVREVLPENVEERYAYTAVGSTVAETRRTDANGNVTTYRFNGFGFLTEQIDALGRKTKYDLDPVTNFVRRMTDPAGRVTQYFYNARGDRTRTIDADGKETKIDYDTRFRKPVRIENVLGNVTLMAYDAQGNLTSVTNAESKTTTFTYTPKGQLETVTDPLSRVTRFTYDVNGNRGTSTNPANETVTRIFDNANRMIELADSLNRSTRFTYDTLDRVTEVRDAASGLTKYAYDANDNLTSVTDPNNNPVERNVYDLRNRLKTRTDAKNRSASYNYDGMGNLTRVTDRRGQVTEYAYDPLNRLARIQDQDGRVTTYTYDLAGNVAQVSDTQSGDLLMSYDVLNRLIQVVTPQGTVAYAYDALGRRTTRTLSGGDVTAYTYDKADRLKMISLKGRTATYSYDSAGRLVEKVLPNGIKTVYDYDGADRVTSIAYRKADDSPIETVTYSYDQSGQRSSRGDGQLPPKDTTFSATHDEANRLATITLAGETFTLSYDDNGNLVSKTGPITGTTAYTWSARNQLVTLSGPTGGATFRYDAFGRRIERAVNGQTTGFLYDGAQAIAELSGSTMNIVYHTGLAIDEVLARYGASGSRTLLNDALMSVIAQTKDDQSIANFYAYSPYGEAIALGPDEGNTLQYTGRENEGTGLYYYRARYYDPVLKRFISEDPIGLEAGPNFYAYVRGNPASYMDPGGLEVTIVVGGSGSMIPVYGMEVGGGVYFGPAGSGEFVSFGQGVGADIAAQGYIGFINGGPNQVAGDMENINVGVGIFGGTLMFDPNTGKFMGLTVGAGPSPLPVSGSITKSTTKIWPRRGQGAPIRGGSSGATLSPPTTPTGMPRGIVSPCP